MDLDELIRTELAAQADRAPDAEAVLAGVPARARARRRRRVLLAAAGAVLAVAVPAVALRPGPDPAPAASAPAGGLIERCLASVPERPATLRAGRVLVTFADRDGRLVWISADGYDLRCPVGRDGRPAGLTVLERHHAGVPVPRGYLPAGTAVALTAGSYGTPDHDGSWPAAAADVAGRVSPQVRRVVVRWTGAPAGGGSAGRAVLPRPGHRDRPVRPPRLPAGAQRVRREGAAARPRRRAEVSRVRRG